MTETVLILKNQAKSRVMVYRVDGRIKRFETAALAAVAGDLILAEPYNGGFTSYATMAFEVFIDLLVDKFGNDPLLGK